MRFIIYKLDWSVQSVKFFFLPDKGPGGLGSLHCLDNLFEFFGAGFESELFSRPEGHRPERPEGPARGSGLYCCSRPEGQVCIVAHDQEARPSGRVS